MYNNILLAMDGSDNAMRAAQEAVKIASLNPDCKIEVVYVIDFSQAKKDILHAQGKIDAEYTRRKKLLPVEEYLKASSTKYLISMIHGEPAPAIIDYANTGDIDLVVIGSRGLNSLQEMVMGSVSHKVMKRVYCPVLVVK